MALQLSISSTPKTTFLLRPSPSISSATGIPSTASYSKVLLLPLRSTRAGISTHGSWRSWTVRMAPDEEKMTRRSPLDFPIVSPAASFRLFWTCFIKHNTVFVKFFRLLLLLNCWCKLSIDTTFLCDRWKGEEKQKNLEIKNCRRIEYSNLETESNSLKR